MTMNTTRPAGALSVKLSHVLSHSFTRSSSAATTTATSFPLKNVTKSNFESALAELRNHVRAADFVAIDLEMTGVTSAPWRDSFEFDRYDVRYLKVKDSAEKFAVLQFGVCPFRWDPSKQSFIAHPHNFYVFPRQELPDDGASYEFLCQTTSIEFLARYQFEFNACIREGISYLSRAQEDEAVRRLTLSYEDELSKTLHSVTDVRDEQLFRVADVLFTERMKKRFCEWRDGLLQERTGGFQFHVSSDGSKQQFETIFFKMRPALCVNGFTSHQQRLMQLVIEKNFDDLCYVRAYGEKTDSQLVVYMDSKDDRELLMREVKDEQQRAAEMKIRAAIGFRHVIDLLSSEKKLLVGHNCFLDVAHIYSKFIGPLPLTAEEFVSNVSKCFTHMIDTKILLNENNTLKQQMKKSSTSLSTAFALLCPQIALSSKSIGLTFNSCVQVEVQVDDLRSSNWNSGAKHEAGYDAFMTGCVFAQACTHLGIDFKLRSSSEILAHNDKLQKYINRLYLSWTSGEIINLCTGNRITDSLAFNRKHYPKISFENIVLIWGFPTKLNARKIRECLCKVFGLTAVISVYHLDESAVFVHFRKPELVFDFCTLKESLETRDDTISVLHPFAELLEGGNTHAAGYETYKEICNSSISKVLFSEQADAMGIKWKTKLFQSNVVVESQEHENLSKEATVNDTLDEKSEQWKKIDNANNNTNSGRYEILDSLRAAEANRVRASSL